MIGGLGNQLFQIAAAYAYAKEHRLELVFPESWNTIKGRPPIWTTYFSDSKSKWKLLPKQQFSSIRWHTIQEKSFGYSEIQFPKGVPFYKLRGYFQSSLYFKKYSNEIRSLLQISPKLMDASISIFTDIAIEDPDGWIGAHVRRGDYLISQEFYRVTDADYFIRARKTIESQIGERGVCWVTDDLDWVYKNLYKQGDKVISGDSLTDFACLSSFRHIIMSNSTFSWWATWLNPKNYTDRKICCPMQWYGPTGPKDYETIYETEWTRIVTTSGNAKAQDCNQAHGSKAGH